MELRGFFDRAVGAAFRDLALEDEAAARYLADLLTRFARTEQVFPRGLAAQRLETVVDMLLDVQAAWDIDAATFHPEHEVNVRRHIGDYTMFMTGLFPERVERVASRRYYIDQGQRAYRFVSDHDRATGRATAPYRRLAERFEFFAGALDYARHVYFPDRPDRPFFRLGLA